MEEMEIEKVAEGWGWEWDQAQPWNPGLVNWGFWGPWRDGPEKLSAVQHLQVPRKVSPRSHLPRTRLPTWSDKAVPWRCFAWAQFA